MSRHQIYYWIGWNALPLGMFLFMFLLSPSYARHHLETPCSIACVAVLLWLCGNAGYLAITLGTHQNQPTQVQPVSWLANIVLAGSSLLLTMLVLIGPAVTKILQSLNRG